MGYFHWVITAILTVATILIIIATTVLAIDTVEFELHSMRVN